LAATIFDILGPVTVGPSSSHTAGAVRLAQLARRLAGGEIVEAEVELFGSLAKIGRPRGTLLAITAGLLGLEPDDERIREAADLARSAGLNVYFTFSTKPVHHPNTARFRLRLSSGGQVEVTGASIGGGVAEITNLDGFDISLSGLLPALVCEYPDRVGMAADVTNILAERGHNIAAMQIARSEKSGNALMVLELDDAPSEDLPARLRSVAGMERVVYLPGVGERKNRRRFRSFAHPRAFADFEAQARNAAVPISTVVLRNQAELLGVGEGEILGKLEEILKVMSRAIEAGLADKSPSPGGLTGGDAARLAGSQADDWLGLVAQKALAVAETNAKMGRIAAAPTAGACGVLPGCLFGTAEFFGLEEKALIRPLLTAGGIGLIIAGRATLSGASGGCQAECGSAAAMAAGALVEFLGGGPTEVNHAAALALKNLLGLTCDPVAGLVEVPCVRRNAFAAATAVLAARMALAGVKSAIPFDEVADAMAEIGRNMPRSYRETSLGGLAVTPTARAVAESLEETGEA